MNVTDECQVAGVMVRGRIATPNRSLTNVGSWSPQASHRHKMLASDLT